MSVNQVQVTGTFDNFGFKYWSIEYVIEGTKKKIHLKLETMKSLNVVSKISGFRKVEQFLSSEHGTQWFLENLAKSTFINLDGEEKEFL